MSGLPNIPWIREFSRDVDELLNYVYGVPLFLLSGGASGGASTSLYTSATTPQNINSSRFTIDASQYPRAGFFLSAIYRAGASGDPARTFYMDLYSLTAGAPVAGSQISGTAQSAVDPNTPGAQPLLLGTTNFKPNMPQKKSDFILRFWSSTAGLYVDCWAAKLIVSRVN